MGLACPASVECDKCGEKAVIKVALTKLKPQPDIHLRLPRDDIGMSMRPGYASAEPHLAGRRWRPPDERSRLAMRVRLADSANLAPEVGYGRDDRRLPRGARRACGPLARRMRGQSVEMDLDSRHWLRRSRGLSPSLGRAG